MHTYYCPKCGSENVLDYTNFNSDVGLTEFANESPMFCVDCHAIGGKEGFSKKPPAWTWRLWRIKLIPLLLSLVISFLIPLPVTLRVIAGTVLYVVLFSITWRRADGGRAFPPYLW
jgi:hypothetical protein